MLRTLSLLTGLALSAGCQPHVFRMDVRGETTVPGSTLPLDLSLFPALNGLTNIDFNQTEEFQNQGVTKDQVQSVKAESIKLRIVSPNNVDFNFLESLQVLAEANNQEALVAEKNPVRSPPSPNPTLALDVKDTELQPFVVAPKMSLNVRGRGKTPSSDTKIEATVGLRVEVKIF